MNQTQPLSLPQKRITVLDALRGFALLGVILIHMLQNFGISFAQAEPRFPVMDEVVQWIGQNLIMGRFINVFAFLFGLSFFIQMDRAANMGIDFRKRFVWRMFLLLLMGLIGHSFYSIEIITIYAVFGLLLIPLYPLKNWVLLLIAGLLLIGAPRIVQATIHNTKGLNQSEATQNVDVERSVSTMPEHIRNPSFLNSVKYNYTERMEGKLNYQFGMYGRGYVTFALFVLGLVVGRIRFFESVATRKKQHITLFVGFVLATLMLSLIQSVLPPVQVRTLMRPEGEYLSSLLLIVKALDDINLVLFSGALTMAFIILYQSRDLRKKLDVLSPYGRMGLTNYEMQGVIGAILFSNWALGSIFGSWGQTELFFLGIIIFMLQIILSKYWLKYFLYGPLEWLWRSGTYLKWQPLQRRKS